LAWHQGVDFATGVTGVEVSSVASGVVTFAGERSGYGRVVEINHGNGYESLYAHNQEILVNSGDIIKKGQVVALSGNSGRSTGPHVHFEIHKNGRVIDPASYINRTNR
jgi:murein DD-endopeptidase MepM/ murein hydrolase activator NlpD